MSIQLWYNQYQQYIEWSIKDFFDTRYTPSIGLEVTYEEALRYAVEWGWKRMRPILAMITFEYFAQVDTTFWWTKKGIAMLKAIIWIEFMHCYTLVHDDLPCMDNDDMRRGKPTVWKKYWESMALLVWDSLQTMSFELLAGSDNMRVIQQIASALWDLWVARWQVRDTFLQHDHLTQTDLIRIHDEKTWIFIVAALVIGTILWWGNQEDENNMTKFGILLWRAFQIKDDILDVEGNIDEVWKKTGKDINVWKWIVSLIGLNESKAYLEELRVSLLQIISHIPDSRFWDIVDFVVMRKY